MNLPVRPPCFAPLARDYGILGFQSPSPVLDTLCMSSIRCACPWYVDPVLNTLCLSLIRCACPRYAVPVLDSLSHYGSSLSLSSTRCACPRYAVPVLNTLSWPFAVPVPLRNRILTLIPLYSKGSTVFRIFKKLEFDKAQAAQTHSTGTRTWLLLARGVVLQMLIYKGLYGM